MSNIQTGAERMPHDLSHLGFLAGQIGRLITISTTPVIAGDSFEMDAVGALRLSPLRRGLAIDSTVDIFTFYVPHQIGRASCRERVESSVGAVSLKNKVTVPALGVMSAQTMLMSVVLPAPFGPSSAKISFFFSSRRRHTRSVSAFLLNRSSDLFEMDAVGALRLSPLRRGLAIDSTVDIFTFYVPHRHVYGEQWIKFMKDGVNATPLPTVNTTGYIDHAAFLGTINPDTNKIPKHLFQGYLNIYNNYFKAPWMPDRTEANPNELNQDDARYGFRCCHLKNIWTAPLPPETELSRQMTTSTTSIDIMGLQAAYANLHTDQERDYFMQRYHDVISSFGGKTSYDADNRPLLVMRSNLWASGYDVDGTDQTSLGQFSGRVQQTYKHSVPRFFVPEHGTMFTLALVRFPPTATKEIQYLNAKA